MQLLTPELETSDTFKIPKGGQVTLLATGLTGADKVIVELVTLTAAGPGGDACCPGPVSLADVDWSFPLSLSPCCGEPAAPVELTAAQPWFVIDTPQEVLMRVVKIADDDAVVVVYKHETASVK
jgi:hypothetical protein